MDVLGPATDEGVVEDARGGRDNQVDESAGAGFGTRFEIAVPRWMILVLANAECFDLGLCHLDA